MIAALGADRPVIVFDHRGTGRSGTSEGLFDHARPGRRCGSRHRGGRCDGPVHVLGHSMGGRVAQWLALDRPELVDRLVLASSGSGRSPDGKAAVARRAVPHGARASLRDGYRAHLAAQIRSTFFTRAFARRVARAGDLADRRVLAVAAESSPSTSSTSSHGRATTRQTSWAGSGRVPS